MSERSLVGAARASWGLVCAGVATLGVMARLPPVGAPPPVLLAAIVALAAAGLGLGVLVRRRAGAPAARQATLGASASGLVLVVLGAAVASGAASGRSYVRAAAEVERASAAASTEAGSWYGRKELGRLQAFALEVDRGGALGKMLAGTFAQPFVPLVVGVDNRAGTRAVAVDLTDAELVLADGTSVAPLDRGAVLAAPGGRARRRNACTAATTWWRPASRWATPCSSSRPTPRSRTWSGWSCGSTAPRSPSAGVTSARTRSAPPGSDGARPTSLV
jgi:hypothetical protein